MELYGTWQIMWQMPRGKCLEGGRANAQTPFRSEAKPGPLGAGQQDPAGFGDEGKIKVG
jgi:hypothetical protein